MPVKGNIAGNKAANLSICFVSLVVCCVCLIDWLFGRHAPAEPCAGCALRSDPEQAVPQPRCTYDSKRLEDVLVDQLDLNRRRNQITGSIGARER